MPASSDSEKDLQHQRLLRVAVPPTPSDSFSVVCTAVTDPNAPLAVTDGLVVRAGKQRIRRVRLS